LLILHKITVLCALQISVGCSHSFSHDSPVLLQYSQDSGMTWSLVDEPCYPSEQCSSAYTDGSIYYAGSYGEWRPVVIPVNPQMTTKWAHFRCYWM